MVSIDKGRDLPKIFFVLFLIAFFIYAILIEDEKWCAQYNESIYKDEYNGVVKRTYLDSSEHLYPTIILKNEREIHFGQIPEILDLVSVGDSIIKENESYKLKIIRNKKITRIFDLREQCY